MSDSVWPHRRAAHQAPPSLGFSRQEHWSGLPFPSPMHGSENESEVAQLCLTVLTTPRTAAYQAPPSMGLSDESIRNLELDLYYLRNTSMAIFSFFAFSLGKNLWQEQFPSDCQAPGVCLRGVTPVIRPRRTWLWQGLPTNQLDPDDNQGAVLSFYPWKTQAQAGTLSLLDGAAPGLSLRWPGKPGLSCSSSASPFHPHSSSTQWRINHCSSR